MMAQADLDKLYTACSMSCSFLWATRNTGHEGILGGRMATCKDEKGRALVGGVIKIYTAILRHDIDNSRDIERQTHYVRVSFLL